MIKRYLSNFTRFFVLPITGWVVSLSVARADVGAGDIVSLFGLSLNSILAEVAAWISNTALMLMSLWVTLTGALLNVSITLTLQIKDFVDSTQGVYIVWQTIRDISGMFIIFMLLYASFLMILGQSSKTLGSPGNLIKNVVIVGILINFSFFITSLLIDASNIVSLTLYRGIVVNSSSTPAVIDAQTAKDCQPKDGQSIGRVNTCVITSQMFKGNVGGISDIFLTYLSPQSIYNSGGPTDANAPADAKPLEILIQGVVGTIIMFTIGLSFLIAALAFIVRFIVLVLLLAFSPIWFASWVIPQLQDKAKTFTTQLNAQLIFMPVYLLLLYAALRILTASTVFTNPSGNAFSGSGTSLSFIPMNYIVLAINDFFIIFLLNIPLVTAMSMGGVASDWINADKFGAKGLWKGVGNFTKRNTLSWGASRANNSSTMRKFEATNPTIGRLVTKNIGKVAKQYDSYTKTEKEDTEKRNKAIGTVSREDFTRNADTVARNRASYSDASYRAVLDAAKEKDAAAYKSAVSAAEQLQKTHRDALTTSDVSILAKLMRSRGSQQAGFAMTKKADDVAEAKTKKKTGETAKTNMSTYVTNEIAFKKEREDATEKANKQLSDVEKEEKNIELEISKINEQIKSTEVANAAKMPANRTSTVPLTQSLSAAQEKLNGIKVQKEAIEKERTDAIAAISNKMTANEKAKAQAQMDIDAAKAQVEKEEFDDLKNSVEGLKAQGGGESKGGSPKPEGGAKK